MSTVPEAAPEPPLSEPARLLNTFVAPAATFADIRRNPRWWVPWLLLSLTAVGYFALLGRTIGFDRIALTEIQRSSRFEQFEQLSPEQQQRQAEIAARVTRYVGFAAPLTTLLVYLLVSAVLMAVFNFGAGAEVSSRQAMAITLYAALPILLMYAAGMVALMVGVDPDGFNIRNPVASNPAYFMDPAHNKFLYGIASALDVFAIWSIALTGIGYSALSKLKRSTAIFIVAGCYLIYKLAASALALL